MDITEQELLNLGFVQKRYQDVSYVEFHKGSIKAFQLIYFDDNKMYLLIGDTCEELPECKTVEDVSQLIRILNIK